MSSYRAHMRSARVEFASVPGGWCATGAAMKIDSTTPVKKIVTERMQVVQEITLENPPRVSGVGHGALMHAEQRGCMHLV